MNKVILLGRLTKNPDIRYSQKNNMMMANFTLAVNRKYVKAGEERQTDFINIVTYSKTAEFVQKYLKVGLQICICGRMQTRVWNDDTGNKHYVTEVIAEEIDFADSQKKADESILYANTSTSTNAENINENTQTEDVIMSNDDDLPF